MQPQSLIGTFSGVDPSPSWKMIRETSAKTMNMFFKALRILKLTYAKSKENFETRHLSHKHCWIDSWLEVHNIQGF